MLKKNFKISLTRANPFDKISVDLRFTLYLELSLKGGKKC